MAATEALCFACREMGDRCRATSPDACQAAPSGFYVAPEGSTNEPTPAGLIVKEVSGLPHHPRADLGRCGMSETFPTRLTGTCGDCGTTTTCEHPDGIGGEGQGWPCLVCGNPVRMDGSNCAEDPS